MRMIVVVLEKGEYKKWMDNKEKNHTFKQTYNPAPAAVEAPVLPSVDSLKIVPAVAKQS
jgi:hypothetical protein